MLFLKDDDGNNSILKREELVSTTLLCQSAYFKKCEEDNWDILIAFQLSAIKDPKKNPHKYITKASEEILKFMNEHVQYFIDKVVNVDTSSIPSQRYTILSIKKWFNPAEIFPIDGYSFEKWIVEKIHDEDTKNVLKRIYRESLKSDGLTIKAQLPNGILNFSEVAKIMHKQDEEVLDTKVLNVIQTTIGIDLNTLAGKVRGSLVDVKKSLSRLYEQNKCSQFWLDLKEQMEPIQAGDIVRLNEAEYKKLVDSLTFKVNAFVVDSIDEKSNHSMKLKWVNGIVSAKKIEAIPLRTARARRHGRRPCSGQPEGQGRPDVQGPHEDGGRRADAGVAARVHGRGGREGRDAEAGAGRFGRPRPEAVVADAGSNLRFQCQAGRLLPGAGWGCLVGLSGLDELWQRRSKKQFLR